MHPLLAPGTHVLRRGPSEVQLGLERPGALVAPGDAPDPHRLADRPELLAALVRANLATTDDQTLRRALPAHDAGEPWLRHGIAALARRTGPDLRAALARRTSSAVVPTTFGHPIGHDLVLDLTHLCRRSGLRVPAPARPGPARKGSPPPVRVHALLGVGEPTRDLLDPWVRDGTPHLLVRLVEGRGVIGPFVVPGRTACVRCIDAYRTEEDPSWPLLVEQYARATRTDRADGIPEPIDPLLASVAIGWAVRDLATYAEGGRPSTASATVRLGPTLESVDVRQWRPHPHCGCTWG